MRSDANRGGRNGSCVNRCPLIYPDEVVRARHDQYLIPTRLRHVAIPEASFRIHSPSDNLSQGNSVVSVSSIHLDTPAGALASLLRELYF